MDQVRSKWCFGNPSVYEERLASCQIVQMLVGAMNELPHT